MKIVAIWFSFRLCPTDGGVDESSVGTVEGWCCAVFVAQAAYSKIVGTRADCRGFLRILRWGVRIPVMVRRDSGIESDPQRLGGVAVFKGTRVPVRNMFDYLEGGQDLGEFLDDFPTVSREAAVAVLEAASARVVAAIREGPSG